MPESVSIDDDTLAAVLAHWKRQGSELAGLFDAPARAGRLHGPQTSPYGQIASEFARHESAGTGGAWHDYRIVTITVRGTKADVTQALAAVLDRFDDRTTLVYPSGARFLRWWPQGDRLTQDPAVKDGRDVWVGEIVGEVWSVRPA